MAVRTFIKTCDEAEKNQWLKSKHYPGQHGKEGHYEAEQIPGKPHIWKIYLKVKD